MKPTVMGGFVAFLPLTACGEKPSEPMPENRLAKEKSPYLPQHAKNPVDWHPWGEEAFAKARAENKPIFVSIGYSTCHWCHVMGRESFSNKESPRHERRHPHGNGKWWHARPPRWRVPSLFGR